MFTEYKGYNIEFNLYGQNEYTVQYCGDDVFFTAEEEARRFIDGIQEEENEQGEPEQITLDLFFTPATEAATEAPEAPETAQPEEVPAEDSKEPETATEAADTIPDSDYFIENKETGKIELYFDKETYLALDDAQKEKIKGNFLFSRRSGAWISRRKFPNLFWPRKVAEDLGLTDAGATGSRLSFAEQQEQKIQKAENRADRYEYKAAKAAAECERLQAPINRMHGDIAFFTQPNINTSSGRAFTRQRNRMWESFERGFEEFRKSEYYKERAETARKAKEIPTKGFCQRRIEDANKDIRALTKNIKAYSEKLEKIQNGEPIYNCWGEVIENPDAERYAAEIDRWNEMLEAAIDKAAYYDALIQQQGGKEYSKDNIKPGYIVRLESAWTGLVVVTSCGPKNIKYRSIEGASFDLTASYAEIKEVVKAEEQTEVKHPFEVGEVFTVKKWNGQEYADKEYTITKITPEKVTVKSGSDRAKTVKVKKNYRGTGYYIYLEDGPNGYYEKSINA